ncbi:hypothetical protein LEP1GSC169_1280 [Leptospira santarosai str. HAI1349]|nr:hypothetical protein LEP1GSC169_1280 [Leptospira santarosai str. HAI1349]
MKRSQDLSLTQNAPKIRYLFGLDFCVKHYSRGNRLIYQIPIRPSTIEIYFRFFVSCNQAR